MKCACQREVGEDVTKERKECRGRVVVHDVKGSAYAWARTNLVDGGGAASTHVLQLGSDHEKGAVSGLCCLVDVSR